ncbi:PKD domain-containing protein [Candidatus Peregrinibacteria bacterium]|nr:PKD domain-containing protein [Candidatus Peregrinibacteria bacterium]
MKKLSLILRLSTIALGFFGGIFLIMILYFSIIIGEPASASGIVYVKLGNTLTLEAEGNPQGVSYSWVLKKGEEVIPQKFVEKGKDSATAEEKMSSSDRTFRHTFSDLGEFTISLILTNTATGEVQSTSAKVLVSLENPKFTSEKAVLKTLPETKADGTLVLSGESAEVIFFPSAPGNPSEFHIDADIAEDSDGDGIADNDNDNKGHASFFSGQAWSKIYQNKKTSQIAQLTVVYDTGKTEKASVEILFTDNKEQKEKPLKAVLETNPPADKDGIIHLSGDEGDVTFFPGNSEGNILEYRIDKNILFDTNQDGNTGNDIDNGESSSFEVSAPWTTNFQKAWGAVTVELLVVGKDKSGSRLQRQIVFDGKEIAPPSSSEEVPPESFQKLIVSQKKIFAGETVDFLLLGVQEGTNIIWDFDGDGIPEYEGIRTSNSYQYQFEGEYPVIVQIKKEKGENIRFEESITVQGRKEGETLTSPPTASFTFLISKGEVTFQSTSEADRRLIEKKISYSWDFGDAGVSDEAAPKHTYAKTGTFTAVLTVTDSIGRSSTTAQNITLTEIASVETPPPGEPEVKPKEPGPETPPVSTEPPTEIPSESGVPSENGGWGILWIIAFILLVPIGLVGIYLVIRKIQLPDLSFEEIIIEDIEKLRGKKHDEISAEAISFTPSTPQTAILIPKTEVQIQKEVSSVSSQVSQGTPQQRNVIDITESAPEPSEAHEETTPEWLKDSNSNTPQPISGTDESSHEDVPDWLKDTHADSEKAHDNDETSHEEQTQSEQVPDWLHENIGPETPAASVPSTSSEENGDILGSDEVPHESHDDIEESEEVPEVISETEASEDENQESEENELTGEVAPPPVSNQNSSENAPLPPPEEEALPDWLKGEK